MVLIHGERVMGLHIRFCNVHKDELYTTRKKMRTLANKWNIFHKVMAKLICACSYSGLI